MLWKMIEWLLRLLAWPWAGRGEKGRWQYPKEILPRTAVRLAALAARRPPDTGSGLVY